MHYLGTGLQPTLIRLANISALMTVRFVVSNLLPFTSPAFAFIVAISMDENEGGFAVFYLLACSMPVGALIPAMDWVAYVAVSCVVTDSASADHGYRFLATDLCSLLTDYSPLSFWVRPCVMEPAFRFGKEQLGASDEKSAAGGVLAGHFMLWAGPATTAYQRKFVPDWLTCVVVQPLGLLEDVAVVLATWAGTSDEHQRKAEISLYIFLLLVNVTRYAARDTPKLCQKWRAAVATDSEGDDGESVEGFPSHAKSCFDCDDNEEKTAARSLAVEHGTVLTLTVLMLVWRVCAMENPVVPLQGHSGRRAEAAEVGEAACAHSNVDVGVMLATSGWVTCSALVFRAVARIPGVIATAAWGTSAFLAPLEHA